MSSKFESEFLKKILPTLSTSANLIVPIGDDCAAVKLENSTKAMLFASDQLIGNVHYFQDSTPPEKAGAKLLKRNLSDIAAMGGKPLYALVNIANGGCDLDYLTQFMQGIIDCAKEYNTLIIGGDTGHFIAGKTDKASALIGSLTIIGEVESSLISCRNNAKDGDLIFITGELGESLQNKHHLNFTPRLQEGQFLAEKSFTDCMMDISDGLLLDLQKMCEMSNISAKINLFDLPLRNKELCYKQITCGEDYELLFAVAPEKLGLLMENWQADFAKLTCIGKFVKNDKIEIYDENNNVLNIGNCGYEH